MKTSAYTPFRSLPPLVGLASFEHAAKPGLGIDASVDRIKRYHFGLKRLMQILQARLTAEPIYELKMAFSLHSHYCAEHCTAMRERVAEMRTPPLGLEKIPNPHLDTFFQEIQNAPTTEELVVGIYQFAFPALLRGLRRHMEETNPLADHPSVRICRFAAIEVEEVVNYGAQAIDALVDADQRAAMEPWTRLLAALLAAAGDLDGSQAAIPNSLPAIHSTTPLTYDKVPKRDERFPDPYNMGVHA
ncbi:MAG TPA: hypothetical protein VD994_06470, partial [Prosthecobacter sp.]|nr:hypothetical protein [Prosthecobacter sp.]